MSRLLRIAAREYVAYVRTVGFWLSMLLMPAIGAVALGAPLYLEKAAPTPLVAVVDRTGEGYGQVVAEALGRKRDGRPSAEIAETRPDPALPLAVALKRMMTEEPADDARRLSAAVAIKGSGEAVSIDFWSRNLSDRSLERQVREAVAGEMQARRLAALGIDSSALAAAQALKPRLTTFSARAEGGAAGPRDRLPGVGFATAMLLWTMIFTGAGILLNSVIEEKSNRVLEVLLASASVPEIMFGKILGVAGVTLTVLAVWAGAGSFLAFSLEPEAAADVAAVLIGQGLIGYFAFYLVGGYLLYAAIFTAIGAFCETTREAQTLLGPIMALLMIPVVFLAETIRRPDSPIVEALSWFPPFSPFLMPARAAAEPPLWEVAATGALMTATVALVVWIAGRAFRAGALSTGKVDLKGLIARIRGGE